ncbi:hypothetical protein [Ornithinimicrobium avium]|uniref:hypothetical protein n=1 Tax=Ornithinimicrobium avium TaxID=2283195 RepID=UPI0013B35DB5|nr:hypothetical protein [Ornithinimicrobium avium]
MRIDLRKDLSHLYRPGTRDFVEVDVRRRATWPSTATVTPTSADYGGAQGADG